jgi:hypothetical protein
MQGQREFHTGAEKKLARVIGGFSLKIIVAVAAEANSSV